MSVPSESFSQLDLNVGRSAFGEDAAGYHKARSGYPGELFDQIIRRTAANPRILEIGAGTGLASEGLLACSPQLLTIVEPDPRLCEFLQQRFERPSVSTVCGPFPESEIEGQFDLVACAAAFHWMEPQPALAKIKSLLVPSGTWAMWWNCYFGHGREDAFAAHAMKILADEGVALPPSYRGGTHYALNVEHHTEVLSRAGFSNIEHSVFQTQRGLSALQARDLYQSFSFIRILPEVRQSKILDLIADAVDGLFGGSAPSVVVTSLYVSSA